MYAYDAWACAVHNVVHKTAVKNTYNRENIDYVTSGKTSHFFLSHVALTDWGTELISTIAF